MLMAEEVRAATAAVSEEEMVAVGVAAVGGGSSGDELENQEQ
jgi:hypothetical protein